jgi:hypothetical protein
MRGRALLVALVLAGCGDEAARGPSATRSAPPAGQRAATAGPDQGAPPAGAATPASSRPRRPARRVRGHLPGARAYRACAAAGDFWPTMVLARAGATTWVACKEDDRLVSLDGARVDLDGARVDLDGPPIAAFGAFGALWALDSAGTLYKIDGSRVAAKLDLQAAAPYNLWAGAGSLWAVDDRSGEVIRIDPAGKIVAKVAVGDGPADIAFAGATAWIVNHRDRALVALDTRTNRARKVATLDAEVPERIATLGGDLWITGRGTDLLRVDTRGRVKRTIEIGGSGIDVLVAGDRLVVPSRSERVDPTGLPTMDALRLVTPGGKVMSVDASDRIDVHGLLAIGGHAWLADTTEGVVYRS